MKEGGQITALKALNLANHDIVTLSIGGNDANFATVLEACIFKYKLIPID